MDRMRWLANLCARHSLHVAKEAEEVLRWHCEHGLTRKELMLTGLGPLLQLRLDWAELLFEMAKALGYKEVDNDHS